MRRVVIVMVSLLGVGGMSAAAYTSYNGFGLVQSGGTSARVGSVGGINILGGGPNSGK
jgi:hypothetical protein